MCGDGRADCDDTRASDHPGAEEQCDGRDNDCSGIADDGLDACNPGNRSPIIDDGGGPGLHFLAGHQSEGRFSASDPDPGDQLTWTLVRAPEGMTIEVDTGSVSWAATSEQQGRHEYGIEVADGFGAVSPLALREALVWKDDDGDGWCETEVDAVEVPDDFCANGPRPPITTWSVLRPGPGFDRQMEWTPPDSPLSAETCRRSRLTCSRASSSPGR
ncbi:MAG TPA: putative metal-binding motif-containing protein [Myxococcota bacterium]|nr:putative metal-binding motif-containing protein [Myxococcota bacterium]